MVKLTKIEIQPGLSNDELLERYGTQSQCEGMEQQSRWSNRFNLHIQRITIFGGELAKPTGLPPRCARHRACSDDRSQP